MTRRRHIVVLNQFALPTSQGGGTRHVELFGKLDAWDATVIGGSRSYLDQRRVDAEGIFRTVPVTRYRGNGIGRVVNWASYTLGALVAGLRHRGTSVIYGSSPHLGAALAALLVARAKRVPFVLEVRDLWPQILVEAGTLTESSRAYRVLKGLERALYRRADRIVVLAEGNVDTIEAEGVDRAKIVFIPNGADVDAFTVEEDRASLRESFGFDRFTVIYTGAHGPANGLDLVLDAAEDLDRSGSDVMVALFGDGVSKEQLRKDAASRGLTNVTFRDPVPKRQIPALLVAADAGLHSLADHELFKTGVSPNKLYDYMAAGIPVITNTGGDVGDMVERAGSGVAVTPDGIAGGVEQLRSASAAERDAMGAAGRQFVESQRSREAMALRLEAMIDELA